jgi:hypothetical protein
MKENRQAIKKTYLPASFSGYLPEIRRFRFCFPSERPSKFPLGSLVFGIWNAMAMASCRLQLLRTQRRASTPTTKVT